MAGAAVDAADEGPKGMVVLNFDVGIANMGVCKVRRSSAVASGENHYPYEVLFWELINLETGNSTVSSAVSAMVRLFMARPAMYRDVTDIAIESQGIARDNIKALASAMQAHFETLSRGGSELLNRGPIRIHVVSPANKLKVCDPKDLDAFLEEKCPDGHLPPPFRRKRARRSKFADEDTDMEKRRQANKKAAEFHCAAIMSQIEGGESWLAWLSQHAKIDDLCDAFLQGCFVLKNEKLYSKKPVAEPWAVKQ